MLAAVCQEILCTKFLRLYVCYITVGLELEVGLNPTAVGCLPCGKRKRDSSHCWSARQSCVSPSCVCVLQLLWSWRSTATQLQWDACLAASAKRIAASVDQQGAACLSDPTLVAVCQVAVQPETAALWLKALLDCDLATSLKGKSCLATVQSCSNR